jgi:hypothetical protein
VRWWLKGKARSNAVTEISKHVSALRLNKIKSAYSANFRAAHSPPLSSICLGRNQTKRLANRKVIKVAAQTGRPRNSWITFKVKCTSTPPLKTAEEGSFLTSGSRSLNTSLFIGQNLTPPRRRKKPVRRQRRRRPP